MRRIVFYSWQSDLPNATNRGLILQALEEAASAITADDTIGIEPVVDRDTQDVPGSPDIASTIFAKVAAADVFVADVSIIGRIKSRAIPNPNVLIELGYALKVLGHERVILVFNRAFGKAEHLPFDLRARRVLVYEMAEAAAERAPERRKLTAQLEGALRSALSSIPSKEEAVGPAPAVSAIENVQPNRSIIVRRNLDDILKRLDALEPKKHRDGGTVDELIDAIGKTQEAVAEFSRIAETIAVMKDADAGFDVMRWFGKVFERYDLPKNHAGRFTRADHDFFKLVGHEMLVSLVAFLMREQRWDLLRKLLDEPIPMRPTWHNATGSVGWEYASAHLELLVDESPRRERVSLHADLLESRHNEGGELGTVLRFEDFMNADFFLFLLGELLPESRNYRRRPWRAWSSLYLQQVPLFLRRAEHVRVAEQIAKMMGLPGIREFKELVAERGSGITELFGHAGFRDSPIDGDVVERIGTL